MILITGGTGFIGRHLATRLKEAGEEVRVTARGVRRADLPPGIQFVTSNAATGEGLAEAMAGVDKVVHLVAIIREVGTQRFDTVNRQGAENVAQAAQAAGVKHFVHQSALGADPDPTYPYLASKWMGEQAVIRSGLPYTILRPSIIFGPDDEFINTLAKLVRWNLVVPIPGRGNTGFQPLWVEDLVRCIMAVLKDDAYTGRTVELGGPEHLTYKEIVGIVKETMGLRRPYVHIPIGVMRPIVFLMERALPRPPVTTRQLDMLAKDNITDLDSVQKSFGFAPKKLREGIGYVRR
ncbi:MAG TPA: complex I NDUFA9 subunit family protein [Dehalococcoidia bacterium]|nr:complex I NDUFA9 subunit family protein [Dehalococcoidia bacterium]